MKIARTVIVLLALFLGLTGAAHAGGFKAAPIDDSILPVKVRIGDVVEGVVSSESGTIKLCDACRPDKSFALDITNINSESTNVILMRPDFRCWVTFIWRETDSSSGLESWRKSNSYEVSENEFFTTTFGKFSGPVFVVVNGRREGRDYGKFRIGFFPGEEPPAKRADYASLLATLTHSGELANVESVPATSQISASRPAAGLVAVASPISSSSRPVARPAAPPPAPAATLTPQAPRIALVIGNSTYAGSLGSLANPGNDARLIAAGLRAVGFQVELLLDANQRTMKQAISRLGQRLGTAGRGSTGLFYYAGHGMQSRGVNFLVPVGAAIVREADIDLESVAADTVLRQMEDAGAATNIVVLDACRNAPIASSFRGGTRGLARMEAPNGSFLSYSTAPGSVAQDGVGRNSPFAQALSAELQKPGQPIEITFRNVRRTVLQATSGQQTPWDASSLIDSFVFKPEAGR